ncbi:hypothetical protein ACJRO7_026354 [Eucalyptus globulus]|uniref:S-protein homolog n=1 Tax=Eucalyptus globulus TaxID=34317 RepID=A0ABD3JRF8_EUCGL
MMNSSAMLIFICSLLLNSCAGAILRKTEVEIGYDLPGETTLTVHCKSKDDDLGFHDITITRKWRFSFRPSIFKDTLFFCSFAWPGQFKWFDIYVQTRDEGECPLSLCVWQISPSGPCRFNENTGDFDICFPWNPPRQLGRKPLT